MGILGHDLRNPLGAILGASTFLRRRAELAPPRATTSSASSAPRGAWRR